MNALIPRVTVSQIVAHRNRAIALYSKAYEALALADAAVKEAHQAAHAAAPIRDGRYSCHLKETTDKFFGAVALPDMDFWQSAAMRIVDTACWQYVIQLTDLEILMDKEAKDKLREQLKEPLPKRSHRGYDDTGRFREVADPDDVRGTMPDFTEESVMATLETFRLEAGTIFRRGLANAFSKLDRRFKSHDGFKIGSRVIFNNAFDGFGFWSHRSNQKDAIYDVERTFCILDGERPESSITSIVAQVENDRRGGGLSPRQSEHEGTYFKIRVFKNGNAHLWFTNDDLVEKANKLLAEYYGEVIGDDSDGTKEADPFAQPKQGVAKHYGFYPTPIDAAKQLLEPVLQEIGGLKSKNPGSPVRALEPSAGTGNLSAMLAAAGATTDCCEMQSHLAEGLRLDPRYGNVWCQDFMALTPASVEPYDVVVMNPPFMRDLEIDHLMHAWKMLKPGGSLHAILPAGVEFRESAKCVAFRELFEKQGYSRYWRSNWEELPPGSFSSVGTNINTVIVRLRKEPA
jgi:hypothetical protein